LQIDHEEGQEGKRVIVSFSITEKDSSSRTLSTFSAGKRQGMYPMSGKEDQMQ
jgi:hypothetical protein